MGAPITRSLISRMRKRFARMLPGLLLWACGGIGVVWLLASGWPGPLVPSASALAPPSWQAPASSSVSSPALSAGSRSALGSGAGGRAKVSTQAALTTAFCVPGDVECAMHTVAQSLAQQVLETVKPIVTGILDNPVDILFQTPAAETYENPAVLALWQALMTVGEVALACVIAVGGYNVMIAPYLGLPQSSIGAFIPRLLLAYAAAHFSLDFLGLFITFENTVCQLILHTAGLSALTNAIEGLFDPASVGNLILFALILVMAVLLLCLLGQMIVRIGMVALLIALAGPALLCLALPQTQRYGRLWLTLFSSSVLVQLFQVTGLALGGMLLTAASATPLWHLPDGIGPALLCIGLLFLVLKLPGMLNHWALGPMQAMTGGFSAGDGLAATQGYLQDQAARQASIDALASLI